MDKFIPSATIKDRGDLPWLTKDIKKLLLQRDKAFAKAKANPHQPRLYKTFGDLKSRVQKEIRQAHNNYVANILTLENTDPYDNATTHQSTANRKRFWSYIKNLKRDNNNLSPLKDNGILVSDSKGQANILNNQYQSVFTDEDIVNMPTLPPSTTPTMEDIVCTPRGIQKLLVGLNPNKAKGPDNLPPRVLKECAPEIAPILTHIFNKSISSGVLPNDWRTANISPIFKKGERYKASNYRPVSLTSICSKLLEHIFVSNITNHYDFNNTLTDCQHGFRSHRSCESQLISFFQDLSYQCQGGGQIDAIIMDFTKAFDKVPHQKLLLKLAHYGIRGNQLKWVDSFLTNRTQRVVVNGQASEYAKVRSGVPQGTVLGPLLFLTYINDLPSYVNSTVRLFADDCVVYRKIAIPQDCQALQTDLTNLCTWEDKWQMEFNPAKCFSVHFTRSRKPQKTIYSLRGTNLQVTDVTTYLGVDLSKDLSWNHHTTRIAKKANRTLGFIKRNFHTAPRETKDLAYKTLVRPQLEYCSTVWDPHTTKAADPLDKVQRRAARFTTNRYHNTSSVTDMLQTLKWEPLSQRRAKQRLIILYKTTHDLVAIPKSYLIPTTTSSVHNHPFTYQRPYTSTDYYKYSFFPRTIYQWNNLHSTIVCAASLTQFKMLLQPLYISPLN